MPAIPAYIPVVCLSVSDPPVPAIPAYIPVVCLSQTPLCLPYRPTSQWSVCLRPPLCLPYRPTSQWSVCLRPPCACHTGLHPSGLSVFRPPCACHIGLHPSGLSVSEPPVPAIPAYIPVVCLSQTTLCLPYRPTSQWSVSQTPLCLPYRPTSQWSVCLRAPCACHTSLHPSGLSVSEPPVPAIPAYIPVVCLSQTPLCLPYRPTSQWSVCLSQSPLCLPYRPTSQWSVCLSQSPLCLPYRPTSQWSVCFRPPCACHTGLHPSGLSSDPPVPAVPAYIPVVCLFQTPLCLPYRPTSQWSVCLRAPCACHTGLHPSGLSVSEPPVPAIPAYIPVVCLRPPCACHTGLHPSGLSVCFRPPCACHTGLHPSGLSVSEPPVPAIPAYIPVVCLSVSRAPCACHTGLYPSGLSVSDPPVPAIPAYIPVVCLSQSPLCLPYQPTSQWSVCLRPPCACHTSLHPSGLSVSEPSVPAIPAYIPVVCLSQTPLCLPYQPTSQWSVCFRPPCACHTGLHPSGLSVSDPPVPAIPAYIPVVCLFQSPLCLPYRPTSQWSVCLRPPCACHTGLHPSGLSVSDPPVPAISAYIPVVCLFQSPLCLPYQPTSQWSVCLRPPCACHTGLHPSGLSVSDPPVPAIPAYIPVVCLSQSPLCLPYRPTSQWSVCLRPPCACHTGLHPSGLSVSDPPVPAISAYIPVVCLFQSPLCLPYQPTSQWSVCLRPPCACHTGLHPSGLSVSDPPVPAIPAYIPVVCLSQSPLCLPYRPTYQWSVCLGAPCACHTSLHPSGLPVSDPPVPAIPAYIPVVCLSRSPLCLPYRPTSHWSVSDPPVPAIPAYIPVVCLSQSPLCLPYRPTSQWSVCLSQTPLCLPYQPTSQWSVCLRPPCACHTSLHTSGLFVSEPPVPAIPAYIPVVCLSVSDPPVPAIPAYIPVVCLSQTPLCLPYQPTSKWSVCFRAPCACHTGLYPSDVRSHWLSLRRVRRRRLLSRPSPCHRRDGRLRLPQVAPPVGVATRTGHGCRRPQQPTYEAHLTKGRQLAQWEAERAAEELWRCNLSGRWEEDWTVEQPTVI